MQQVAALFGVDTSIYNERATDIFNTVLAILVLMGVVVDPTTAGTSDCEKTLGYKEPCNNRDKDKDKDEE